MFYSKASGRVMASAWVSVVPNAARNRRFISRATFSASMHQKTYPRVRLSLRTQRESCGAQSEVELAGELNHPAITVRAALHDAQDTTELRIVDVAYDSAAGKAVGAPS